MSLFTVSDIHGYFTPLEEALRKNGFFKDKKNKLLVLGDALDRGQEAQKVVGFLLQLHREGRLVYIKGNHEDLFINCLQACSRGEIFEIASGMSHHYRNGTFDTLLQLSEMTAQEAVSFPNELVRRIMRSSYYQELLPFCVNYFETDTHVFCHGFVPTHTQGFKPFLDYIYNPDWRNANEEEWYKARWLNPMELVCKNKIAIENKVAVTGHFHASWGHSRVNHSCSEWGSDAIFTPFYADGIIAIDACTAYTNTVNCVVFEE